MTAISNTTFGATNSLGNKGAYKKDAFTKEIKLNGLAINESQVKDEVKLALAKEKAVLLDCYVTDVSITSITIDENGDL